MRLFQALWRQKHLPNGHIFRGKQRLVRQVTPLLKQSLRNDFAIEEENMLYLRHPFLTPEQSFGHAKALGKSEQRMYRLITKEKEFKPNVTIESRLSHLRFREPWD